MSDTTPQHSSPPTPRQAAAALALAAKSSAATVDIGRRWIRAVFLSWAAMTTVVVLLVGLGGTAGIIAGSTIAALFAAGVGAWAARQGVWVRGLSRRYLLAVLAWALLYAGALAVGTTTQAGNAAFWIPSALLTAAPMLLAALRPTGVERVA
ncbi:hypothetical protein [Oerskovia turbata]